MLRSVAKIVLLSVMVLAGSVGIYVYHAQFSSDQKIIKLEREKAELKQIVQRLTDERRVAEVLVTDEKTVNGVKQTTLLFVEYARDGTSLPPKSFTIDGNIAHIDAMIVKFEHGFVEKDDPLRGRSIALFTKLYGEHQKPDSAYLIDAPGTVPDYYRGANPQVSAFEQDLWNNFWRLADDANYRAEKGVRIANGQGVWGPFEMDRLYTITIETDGGLNVSSEPLRGIYREALKRRLPG